MNRWIKIRESTTFREFYFLALALVLAFGMLQFTGTLFATDKPVVSVVSCSMYPKYHVGDVLLVRGTPFEQIEEGEIVVYDAPDMDIPIVHRVIEKRESSLETRGDNNPSQLEFEKNVTPDQIHGTVLFSIPRVGGLKLLAMDLAGLNDKEDNPDVPLVIDNYPRCSIKVPLDQR